MRKFGRCDADLPFRLSPIAPGLCYQGGRGGLCPDRFLFRISSMSHKLLANSTTERGRLRLYVDTHAKIQRDELVLVISE